MRSSSRRGSFSIGGGAKVPAWVPDYPGSDPRSAFSAQGSQGESGSFTFKTRDQPDKVIKFYRDWFQTSGLNLTTNITSDEPHQAAATLVAEDDAKSRSVTVIVGREASDTTVSVTYANK